MTHFTKVFGAKLLKGDSEVNTAEALAGLDAVGIYFSAHWCPPCRGFTPQLAEKYKQLKEAGKKFEIVFASSDKDEGQFKDYFAEMPWLALPFSERDTKAELSAEYNCRGIPYLVMIDGQTGATITTDGRAEVSDASFIQNFPWKPTPMSMEEFGPILRNPDGSTISTKDALEGVDAIGIYFSAHWCPPCRGFTPVAAENYKALKAAGKKVEIVFASSDKDETQFNEYHGEMPWKALPYAERDKKASLAKRYKCSGIPHLVFVDPKTWETITLSGRGAFSTSTFIEDFPYHPKTSYDLSEDTDGLMGNKPVLICFTDKSSADTQKEVSGVVRAFADKAKVNNETHLFKYFTGNGSSGMEAKMRPSFGIGDSTSENPHMFVLSFTARKFWAPNAGEEAVTLENIEKLLENHKAGKLVESKLNL